MWIKKCINSKYWLEWINQIFSICQHIKSKNMEFIYIFILHFFVIGVYFFLWYDYFICDSVFSLSGVFFLVHFPANFFQPFFLSCYFFCHKLVMSTRSYSSSDSLVLSSFKSFSISYWYHKFADILRHIYFSYFPLCFLYFSFYHWLSIDRKDFRQSNAWVTKKIISHPTKQKYYSHISNWKQTSFGQILKNNNKKKISAMLVSNESYFLSYLKNRK